jgi:hypothetical protein
MEPLVYLRVHHGRPELVTRRVNEEDKESFAYNTLGDRDSQACTPSKAELDVAHLIVEQASKKDGAVKVHVEMPELTIDWVR